MYPNMSHEERQERQERNERRILDFIASEGVSTAAMLAELLGYQHPQSVYKVLRRLEENKLLRTRKMDFIGNLYLLTQAGNGHVTEGVSVKNVKAHEINPFSMPHRLAIQKCHIAMIKNNVRWEASTGRIKKGKQKPDGVIWFHDMHEEPTQIAIEVELTVKTKIRYRDIYYSYCRMQYDSVIYIVPDESMKKRIKSIFDEIRLKDTRSESIGAKKQRVYVFTLEKFASTFTAEYSEKRRAEIITALQREAAEAPKKREADVGAPASQRTAQEPQPVVQPLTPAPPKKKWGLF